MAGTFMEEFQAACERLSGDNFRTEADRVHREAARDKHHAFGGVEVKKPDPWKNRVTGLSL